MLTERTPRVAAARKLLRRAGRDKAGRFLVEGAQAVREAVSGGARVHEVFATGTALSRNADVVSFAEGRGIPVTLVTDAAAEGLSETVTPQGLVAVCDLVDVPLDTALQDARLVAVLVNVSEPGNAGTVLRAADAAGAAAVVFGGDSVDPHNGKAVRASTGSLFHLPVARERDLTVVRKALAGLTLLAADGHGELDLHAPEAAEVLAGPTAWIFGGEAHGLPATVLEAADHRVRVPLYGRAESLNLATAAAICLYASAAALRPIQGSRITDRA
ncbi:RNA methyltransferase [Pseudonocardia ailaonensis]|uniref:RNA methyltransferase n=1 Tax=Pseudonocardia ailaonensis TaxID=367279 RepID=A0ABN2NPV6_9PSEU